MSKRSVADRQRRSKPKTSASLFGWFCNRQVFLVVCALARLVDALARLAHELVRLLPGR